MGKWLRRIRGAVGMGLTWAVAGFLAGIGIELTHNIWPNPLAGLGQDGEDGELLGGKR